MTSTEGLVSKIVCFFWGGTFQKLGENEPQFDEHMFQIHSG